MMLLRLLATLALRMTPFLALSLVLIPTQIARAGTTGGISGVVVEVGTSAPIAGAKVTVTSPSQSAAVTTDAQGRFAFVSLAPDEYTISLQKNGYEPLSYAGVAVLADAVQTLTLSMRVALRTIANVTSRSGSSLVKPGTTADVYSINAAQQARTAVLGGGGALNSAYSAIASVPGAYVPANQNGYLQAVHVRGGDASEVGYEFDGIPVNRAFDNYPSGSLSSLGQLELQVYTGATPANAEAQGLAGFVNQVIKSGTFPGYATANLSLGSPIFYHSANVEVGGATPDRMFSYYVGVGGYNQDYRYVDQFGGAAYANEFGQQLAQCPTSNLANLPSCFTNGKPNVGLSGAPGWLLGPFGFGTINAANVATRTSVVNFHVAIPHRNDGLRDDVQLLYDNDEIFTTFFSSVNDEGYANWINSVGAFPPYYLDSYQYRGPVGSYLPANYPSLVTPYLYPSSPPHALFGPIPDPYNQRDRGYNGQAIVKLQYQKNFSSSAYLRVYGYTYYSDWIENGPMMSLQPYAFYDSGDYEINNHTRGVSVSFADQLSPQHLLEAEGTYTTSRGARIYNEQMFDYADSFAVLVNPNALMSGTCYAVITPKKGAPYTMPTTCSDGGASGVTYGSLLPTFASLSGVYSGSLPPSANGLRCGGGPCAYYALENGAYGLNNTVTPYFTGYSLTDQWRPSDKLFFNLGVRVDNYDYVGANTNFGAARNFWFNAFNQDTCFDTRTLTLVDRSALVGSSGWSTNSQRPCSAFGKQYVNANMRNIPGAFDYNIPQPRFGMTYTVNPNTVLRASYGRYNEQPSAAYEQYNGLQQNLPDSLAQFYPLGFTTPGHEVAPSVSYNSDLSIEHRFPGTDMSFKLTPFLRQTQDQIENFYINYTTGLVSGLNAGYQTSKGFEFQFDKGDFSRNGFAGQLSFAYTYATVTYSVLPNGTTVISPINSGISQYNAYTEACARGGSEYGKLQFGQAVCGATTNGLPAAACYTAKGAPDPSCKAPDAVANPYWRSPAFSLFDPNASYLPYSIFPGPIGSGVNAFTYPYVATLILNYRHDRFTITPSFQFVAGNRYGAPLTTPGIDPAAGCGEPLAGSTTGDP
ncbi:MAG: TonB-dependent receptor, partial [Candidatus Eremiobacteraeota bacterium]|nr:TonB-dependent receptor [Candidatus Eremiobacteraeota bacterium]